ncbi:MAG TPA: S9 family peptidase [Geminicoccaceae bacterium]|nr:S9 family peptidase [Geminicoccus sp.]HMU48620.1 S9 family peptidase [Geminicoccaceae bacterium]
MGTLPYGAWPSPITPDLVASTQVGLSFPQLTEGHAYWCEGRPTEGGRVALVRRGADGATVELGPAGFNLRTRVHEYGGRAYAVRGDLVVGCEMASQRLHRLSPGTAWPLTPDSGGRLRYADLLPDPKRNRVVAVREDHRGQGEAVTTLVAVPLGGEPHEGVVLARGHDFFAAPALSDDGSRLAWLTWDHPTMPWDETSLWVASLDAAGMPADIRRLAGGDGQSVLQPLWLPDGSLVYASDRSGWWNLWRWDGNGHRPLCPMPAEFAGPLWQLGASWYDLLDPATLVVTIGEEGFGRLALLHVADGSLAPLGSAIADYDGPSCAAGKVLVVARTVDRPPELRLVDPAAGSHEVLRAAGTLPVEASFLSRPRSIRFPSRGGRTVQAFHYPPTNPLHRAPEGELPPLILRSHGGPTGQGSAGLALALQFWTSRGFAVVDVNYGGSTGFGRDYRRLLDGQWGIVDVEDCIAAAEWLVAQELADPRRLAIRGGSAAGYTTLCALTFHDTFRAGASHYGIGDLETLAHDTHKFESRYLDRLIGPYPERADLYRARSPIHFTDRLSCPVIFFQGLDDLAVPPNQAEAMVAALRAKRLPVAYLSFAGEGHGFRRAETQIRVLEAEHAFFCRIFGIVPPDGLAPLDIENLGNGPGG